jgi:hypothetical protein
MANIQAVAEYMLETHGSIEAVKAATSDPAVIAAVENILAAKQAAQPMKQFLELIASGGLSDVEKNELGAFCTKYGVDGPTIFRLYKVFRTTKELEAKLNRIIGSDVFAQHQDGRTRL